MRGGGRSVRSGGMDDEAVVARQLGRTPRAFRRVAVRCPFGRPAAVSRIESAGGVERWSERARTDADLAASLERATVEQRALRRALAGSETRPDEGRSLELGIAGSSAPAKLKCLHAHAAFALARPGYELGEGIVAEVGSPWPVSGCCTAE